MTRYPAWSIEGMKQRLLKMERDIADLNRRGEWHYDAPEADESGGGCCTEAFRATRTTLSSVSASGSSTVSYAWGAGSGVPKYVTSGVSGYDGSGSSNVVTLPAGLWSISVSQGIQRYTTAPTSGFVTVRLREDGADDVALGTLPYNDLAAVSAGQLLYVNVTAHAYLASGGDYRVVVQNGTNQNIGIGTGTVMGMSACDHCGTISP